MIAPPPDEMVDGRGGLRAHWRGVLGAMSGFGEGSLAERARRLDRAFEEEGITALLPGASAAEQAWRCDPVPLPTAGRRVRRPGGRAGAARGGAAGGAGRSVRRAAAAGRGGAAAGAGARQSRLFAAGADAGGAGAAVLRRRPGARAAGWLDGAGRPDRRRERHRLCAGEPAAAEPGAAGDVPPAAGAPVAAVLRHLAGRPAPAGPGQRSRGRGGGAADAGHAQPAVVRACLPVARALLRIGGGRRPDGAGRAGVPQDAQGVAAMSACPA